jgi:hypothetical protein
MNNAFDEPTVVWHSPDTSDRPLVALLHGRGADEAAIIGLAAHPRPGPRMQPSAHQSQPGKGTPGSPTVESAVRSRSLSLRPWLGSGSGLTTWHLRAAR